ncbi:hypothetical protein MSAN_00695200 [Mycena sanguinolenta]|uniref:Uncharacterized protein n=1 Tax=Mycena sanguinolenta TaxID=230812 RepID=A0A8H6Z4F0_9AGAR|nr:hypothetical protein MSAN_00695200 [Mycena sanguinolenta]
MYEIETPEVAKSEAYLALQAPASDREAAIKEQLGGLSRRTYVHTGTYTHPDTTPESLPCKFALVVALEMSTPEEEEDLNRWYNEEHMDQLSKIPGWKQGRRYELKEFNQKGSMADKPVFKYLAIHEFVENNFMESPEFKHASSTEWRARIMKNAGRKARVFELYEKF